MNSLKSVFLALLLTSTLTGCSHVEKRQAITGESSKAVESLGSLEVHLNTNPWLPANWWNDLKEIFTLSFADTSYEKRLNGKLVKESKKYGAEQVINVTFWPDLNSRKFPEGKVYARGEMVRYHRFEAQS